MAIKVRCQHCGKLAQFSDGDGGMTALCVACGGRFTIPYQSTAQGSPSVGQLAALEKGAAPVAAMFSVPSSPQVPAGAPPVPATPFPPTMQEMSRLSSGELPQPKVTAGATLVPGGKKAVKAHGDSMGDANGSQPSHKGLIWGMAAAGVLLVGVLVAVLVAALQPTWEDEHASHLRDLKTRADQLVVEKRLPQAYVVYREITEMTAGRNLRDSKLRADVEQSRATRDELFEVLFKNAKAEIVPTPPVAVAPEAVTPAPVAPPAVVAVNPAEVPRTEVAVNPPATQSGAMALPSIPGDPPPGVKPEVTAVVPTPPVATKPSVAIRTPSQRVAEAPAAEVRRPSFMRRRAAIGDTVSDEEIGKAIQDAVNYLLGQFQNGVIRGGPKSKGDAHYAGLDALCVYALMQASYSIKDERLNPKGPLMREMIAKMKDLPMEQGPVTYARAIRATALALLNRPEDREALRLDVAYLVNGHSNGSYSYAAVQRMSGPQREIGDNSNAQYGLLGVWSSAEAGIEVNNTYWMAVDGHWARCQYEDGSWGYTSRGPRGGRLSMSLAGVASMYVTHDYLEAPKYGVTVGRDPFSPSLKKGLDYLETGDNAVQVDSGYTLYGLERVGLASGFKFFGAHDWYREMARVAVDTQRGGAWMGSWGVDVNTAYHLLFLARGRHPILMNKLRFDGGWANRPRDVANLAKYGSKELERPLNWQVVPITRDWTDWTDSPILSISSHLPLNFNNEQAEKLRRYVEAGGMLYTQADGNGVAANKGFEDLAKKVFPLYEMRDLPEDHEIYTILFKPNPRPKLRYVTNGVRVLMVHSPTDISAAWQLRQEKTKKNLYDFGLNLFLYATGKADLRNRLASAVIPAQGAPGGGTLRVARLKYAGAWDPEPMAWERLARLFQRETDVGVNVSTVELDKIDSEAVGSEAGGAKPVNIAHWTGSAAHTMTAGEVAAAKKFVEAGGVLLVEAAGGNAEFAESAKLGIARLTAGSLSPMPLKHPMLTGAGQAGTEDLSTPVVRPFVRSRGGTAARLEYTRLGKGWIIFSHLDLSFGILGANTWGVYGYDPAYATSLVKNILIWQAMGMKE